MKLKRGPPALRARSAANVPSRSQRSRTASASWSGLSPIAANMVVRVYEAGRANHLSNGQRRSGSATAAEPAAAVLGELVVEERHRFVVATAELVRAYRVAQRREERVVVRSEERRVGKECRSRWSPEH